MPDLHIVSMADAPRVAEAVAALLQELDPTGHRTATTLFPVVTETLSLQSVTGILATDEKGTAGLVMLNDCAAIYAGGRFGEITELWIRPDLRSQGLASRMLHKVREIGATRGWHRIEVGAPNRATWARTLAFYQREGFAEVGPRLRCLL
ncbi:GNAT family N-acetyltransferase [Puniceibacterium sediminis]|uniref:Acetyltransferase (GNAT) domain-containing protein n=1 Tax=Puniceibacterium sediminis TaxID=1608407 RepID=A0A238WPT1_9RHOB|nr:GNAT family N-acetyltransferase [Puniceibacterium sediminis]SNR48264.1 Acetyltransferase (GNAT) domain-containing protein [Puniceibacterium sediminis]